MAEAVGISRSYLSGIETGKDLPGRNIAAKLAKYYGVSLEWLLHGDRGGPILRSAGPLSPDEQRIIEAFRALPDEEAQDLLGYALKRAAKKSE